MKTLSENEINHVSAGLFEPSVHTVAVIGVSLVSASVGSVLGGFVTSTYDWINNQDNEAHLMMGLSTGGMLGALIPTCIIYFLNE